MTLPPLFSGYDPDGYFCELLGTGEATVSGHHAGLLKRLGSIDMPTLERRANDALLELYDFGVTFTVYSDKEAIDRILPFDIIPRPIDGATWKTVDAGIKQRVTALNLFLEDIYHGQKILYDGVVPSDLILGNANYRPEMRGLKVPHGVYVHINGTDLVRDEVGRFLVLEDNARTPSGVSYVVENRHLMMRTFPDLLRDLPVRPVSDYGQKLLEMLASVAPPTVLDPRVVLLSPGTYNSAFSEHIFLAREMGVPLVEGADLFVDDDDRVQMRTVAGPKPVDVIYRRIDDDFLDPEVFRPDSMLGVPGIMRAVRRGTVTLANAVGTGVADDKAVYAYLPRIIKYYLDQDPILDNVPTNICREEDGLRHTLDHLHRLVVKPVGLSGGYGIVLGPMATSQELAECREQILADPAGFISQPMVGLSVCPTLAEDGVRARHVDLRPFALSGKDSWVLPGGLTRVALREGAFIVNSSQGGGSKDTWVFE